MSNITILNQSKKQTWRTPESILRLVSKVAPIALDPSADKDPKHHFAPCNHNHEGLSEPWRYDVTAKALAYCNPPYGPALKPWSKKIAEEGERGVQIISLVPARPDTQWWLTQWNSCQAMCFWTGRIKFEGADNGAPFPSAFFYWGKRAHLFAHVFEPHGLIVMRRPTS